MANLQVIDNKNFIASVDAGTNPQQLLLKDVTPSTDVVSFTQSQSYNQSFPVAVNTINMGQIATAKALYIKPAANVVLIFNGSADPLTFLAGKASILYMNFTSVTMTVAGAPAIVEILILG
jgi:hypothetical protein